MTRTVEHTEFAKGRCKCGAAFKKPGELRRHIAEKNGGASRSKRRRR